MTMPRMLRTTRRVVPITQVDDYLTAWRRVQDAALAAGAHAWLFRGRAREDHFIEFLESSRLDAVLENDDVAAAIEAINDTFGGAQTEEWEEAPAS